MSPSETVPVAVPPMVETPSAETGVFPSPKLREVFPTVATVPRRATDVGAVAVNPPLKVKLSSFAFPSTNRPVLPTTVAPATDTADPVSDRS